MSIFRGVKKGVVLTPHLGCPVAKIWWWRLHPGRDANTQVVLLFPPENYQMIGWKIPTMNEDSRCISPLKTGDFPIARLVFWGVITVDSVKVDIKVQKTENSELGYFQSCFFGRSHPTVSQPLILTSSMWSFNTSQIFSRWTGKKKEKTNHLSVSSSPRTHSMEV